MPKILSALPRVLASLVLLSSIASAQQAPTVRVTFAAGRIEQLELLCMVLFGAGIGWIGILACLNVAAQTMSPAPLRARALSMYLLVLQGGMALGSALWGELASRFGVPAALLLSAVALLLGLFTVRRHRLTQSHLEFAPSVVRD